MESQTERRVLSDGLKRYLAEGFAEVHGWCDERLWNVIELLAALHREAGVAAPACEIGVHHGKFFLGLVNTVESERRSLAIDIFDQQELNIDQSGKGSLKKFMANVAEYADPDVVAVLEADSLTLGPPEIATIFQSHGKFAFFSVDGGHTVEHTVNDLLIAMQLTAPGGVIFVDDYYNPSWPGVQEGVVRLFTLQTPNFAPICYTCSKLMLTDISHHDEYFEALHSHLQQRYPGSRVKVVKRFGWNTLTVTPTRDGPIFTY